MIDGVFFNEEKKNTLYGQIDSLLTLAKLLNFDTYFEKYEVQVPTRKNHWDTVVRTVEQLRINKKDTNHKFTFTLFFKSDKKTIQEIYVNTFGLFSQMEIVKYLSRKYSKITNKKEEKRTVTYSKSINPTSTEYSFSIFEIEDLINLIKEVQLIM